MTLLAIHLTNNLQLFQQQHPNVNSAVVLDFLLHAMQTFIAHVKTPINTETLPVAVQAT